MKRIISGLILLGLFIGTVQSVTAAQMMKHEWFNGKVAAFSMGSITVGDNVYAVDTNVKVIQHVLRKNSIYEEPAKLRDVRIGDTVSVRIESGSVAQIIIERYH